MLYQLKFVMMRDGSVFLAIGDRNYHQEMTGDAPRSAVMSAGWVTWDSESHEISCYGESIGYRIGFRVEHEEELGKIMKKNADIINTNMRFGVKLNGRV